MRVLTRKVAKALAKRLFESNMTNLLNMTSFSLYQEVASASILLVMSIKASAPLVKAGHSTLKAKPILAGDMTLALLPIF
jgi:hypothetical protein